MKKILSGLVCALLVCQAAYAAKLNNYQETVAAVKQGKHVTMVIDITKCDTNNKNLADEVVLHLPEVVLIKRGVMRARIIIPTGSVESFPGVDNVYQTAWMDFDQSNQLKATLHVLDPVTYKDLMPATKIRCELGKAFNVYS